MQGLQIINRVVRVYRNETMSQTEKLQIGFSGEKKELIARRLTDLYLQTHSTPVKESGKDQREKWEEITHSHLVQLISGIRANSQRLFNYYLNWVSTLQRENNISIRDLMIHLQDLKELLNETLEPDQSAVTDRFLDNGIRYLKRLKPKPVSYLNIDNPFNTDVKAYLNALLQGDRNQAARLIDGLIEQGVSVKEIYEFVFEVSQYEIGALWQANRISVAQEHFSTAATQQNMARLYPQIFSTERNGMKLVACTVAGELHEIGIRMVSDFFEMEGWDTYYMGANMPATQMTDVLEEYKADVFAISVSLTDHIDAAESLIHEVRKHKHLDRVRIMAGGIPFNMEPNLWKKIGADASAPSAKSALSTAEQWSVL